MDVVVKPSGEKTWSHTDRLGRTVGAIAQPGDDKFVIQPVRNAMPGINAGPFTSLALAAKEIAERLRGSCEIVEGGA